MEYLEVPWRPDGAEDDEGDRGGDPRDAMAQLGRIRELMEGTAVYRVLSGGSAKVAGAIALAACAASWLALGATFLAAGAGAAIAPALNLAWLAAGFGVAHIVYGALVGRGGSR